MTYLCETCKEATHVLYADPKKDDWVCEKCLERRDKHYAAKIKASERELERIKRKEGRV